MSFLDYNYLVRISDKIEYDAALARKCIILANNCKKQRISDESKIILFKMLSKIVIKNIENFFSLVKIYDNVLHTKNDLVGDAFFVLMNCINGFDIKLNKQFYFYYNKALTRAFIRIIEKNYYKHRDTQRVPDGFESFLFLDKSTSGNNLLEFYFDLFRLTDDERRIVKSRLLEQNPRDFVSESDFTMSEYKITLEIIRDKTKALRDEI